MRRIKEKGIERDDKRGEDGKEMREREREGRMEKGRERKGSR